MTGTQANALRLLVQLAIARRTGVVVEVHELSARLREFSVALDAEIAEAAAKDAFRNATAEQIATWAGQIASKVLAANAGYDGACKL